MQTRRALPIAPIWLAALAAVPTLARAAAPVSPCLAVAQDEVTDDRAAALERAIGGWLTLPEGPLARVTAAISRTTAPVALDAEARAALAPEALLSPATWARWRAALVEVAAAEPSALPHRALSFLACQAAGQGRSEDAWRWLARHGAGAPEHVAGVLAYFIPGIPASAEVGPGGKPLPLPDGVSLRPVAPPNPEGFAEWQLPWREALVYDLPIGAARVDTKLVLESAGGEVRLTHVGGAKAQAVVHLAPVAGYELVGRYLDWEPMPADAPAAVVLDLEPGSAERVLWGRLVARTEQRPATPPRGQRPAQLALGGLELAVTRGDVRRPLCEALAVELAGLLGIRVQVVTEGAPRPSASDFAPLTVHIPPGDAGLRALAALAGMVERYIVPR